MEPLLSTQGIRLLHAALALTTLVACNGAGEANAGGKSASASVSGAPAKSSAPAGASAPSASAVASAPAPSVGPAPTPVACDGPEFIDLAKQLDTAGGVGVADLGSDKGRAEVEAAQTALKGRRVAFKNCVFKRQGNDEVTFSSRKDAKNEITCRMAGGEDGNRKFLDAAMTLDTEKMRLDVSGLAASNGSKVVERYLLTECVITPHE